ncbi:MAG: CHAT domain-containing protein [Spirulinaceae cyanobacterium]
MRRFRVLRWLLLTMVVALCLVGGRSLPVQSITTFGGEPPRSGEAIAQVPAAADFSVALGQIEAAEQAYAQGDFVAAGIQVDGAIKQLEALPISQRQQQALAHSFDLAGAIAFSRSQFAAALGHWQGAARIYQGTLAGSVFSDRLRDNLVNQAQAQQKNGQFEQACTTLLRNFGLENASCLAVNEAIVKQNPDDIKPSEALILERIFDHSARDRVDVHTRLQLGDLLRKGGYFAAATAVLDPLTRTSITLPPAEKQEIALALANVARSEGDSRRAQAAAGLGIQFSINLCPSLTNVKITGAWPGLYQTAIDAYDAIESTAGTESEAGLKAWIAAAHLNLALNPDIKKIPSSIPSPTPAQLSNPRLQESLLGYAQLLRCYAQAARDAGNPPQSSLTATPLASWQNLFTQYLQQATDVVTAIAATPQAQANAQVLSYSYGYLGEFKAFAYETVHSTNPAKQTQKSEATQQDPLLIAARDLTQQAIGRAGDSSLLRYQWLWQMGRILRQAPVKQPALDALDYYQSAYVALQSLRNNLVAFNQSIQYDFRDRVEPLYREYVDLLLTPESPDEAIAQTRLQDARHVIESLQLAELDQFFQDDCTRFANVDVGTVDETAAFFFTIFLRDRLEIIVAIEDQDLLHESISEDVERFGNFESVIGSMHTILSGGNATPTFKKNSAQVYDWLIRPFLPTLQANGIQTLVFSLDDVLQGLPVAALLDNQSDEPQYLVDQDFLLAVVPSSRIFPPRRIKNVQLKVLGAALSDFSQHGDAWPNLPNTEPEVCNIKRHLCPHKEQLKPNTCPDDAACPAVKTLLAQGFNRDALQAELQEGDFSIVHIATHGQFSSDQNETYLLAADHKLRLNELAEIFDRLPEAKRQKLELLVLSACKTAKGNRRAALGMAGMALRSGAQSTIASLWQVDDFATMELMGKFYAALQASPERGKAHALHEAQLRLKQQTQYSDPSYWAPFTLIGNWL